MSNVVMLPGRPPAPPEPTAVRVRLDFNEWWVETLAEQRIISRERQSCETEARRLAARYSAERGLAYLPLLLPPPCRFPDGGEHDRGE